MSIESETSDVKIETEDLAGNTSFLFILRNFGTGDDRLREQHKTVVERIASLVVSSPSLIAIYGLASRSGGPGLNLQLSKQRVGSVMSALASASDGVPLATLFNPNITEVKSFGEDFAEFLGVADGDNDSRARAVEVFVWPDLTAKRLIFANKKIRQFAATRPADVLPAAP